MPYSVEITTPRSYALDFAREAYVVSPTGEAFGFEGHAANLAAEPVQTRHTVATLEDARRTAYCYADAAVPDGITGGRTTGMNIDEQRADRRARIAIRDLPDYGGTITLLDGSAITVERLGEICAWCLGAGTYSHETFETGHRAARFCPRCKGNGG